LRRKGEEGRRKVEDSRRRRWKRGGSAVACGVLLVRCVSFEQNEGGRGIREGRGGRERG